MSPTVRYTLFRYKLYIEVGKRSYCHVLGLYRRPRSWCWTPHELLLISVVTCENIWLYVHIQLHSYGEYSASALPFTEIYLCRIALADGYISTFYAGDDVIGTFMCTYSLTSVLCVATYIAKFKFITLVTITATHNYSNIRY